MKARDVRSMVDTGSHMGLCLQNMAGGGSRALRRVLAAARRGIIGGRYGGNSGAANARGCACESRQQDRGDIHRRHHVRRDRRSFSRRADRHARRLSFSGYAFASSSQATSAAFGPMPPCCPVTRSQSLRSSISIRRRSVFTTMTDRMAAITIGILCVTLINDVFGSPPVWRGLDRG